MSRNVLGVAFLSLVLAVGGPAFAGITHTVLSGQLSEDRQSGAATSVGTEALFAGGLKSDLTGLSGVDIYDAATNTWWAASLSEGRLSMAATTVGGKALFAGGRTDLHLITPASDRVDIYEGGVWSTASLSQARSSLAATSVGDQALFAGGSADLDRSAVVDIYQGGAWSTGSLSQARSGLAATSAGTQALFAGGLSDAGVSDVVDRYDSTSGSWSTAHLSQARSHLAATTAGGVALFGGGTVSAEPPVIVVSAVVDIYDAATRTWRTASLSQARSQLAATSVGDFAFFAGGFGFDTEPSSSNVVDIYHVPSDTWYTAQLSIARMNLMGTRVGNKAIFAGGGSGGKQVDIFELTDTTTWTRPAASGAGDWAEDANWDSVVGPFVTDDVLIANGGTAQVSGTAQADSVTLSGGSSLNIVGGTLTTGALAVSGTVNLTAGTLTVTDPAGPTFGPGSLFSIAPGAALSVAELSNAGTLVVLSPSIDFGGGLTNTGDAMFMGTTVAGPVYTPTGSTVTILNTVTFNDLVSGGGSFWGPGTAVFNAGHEPGDSPGLVTFEGSVAYGPLAHLVMEIGGPVPGDDYDVLVVGGSLVVDGTLEVRLIDGYVPPPDSFFDVFDFDPALRSGEFSSIVLPAGYDWDMSAIYDTGVIRVMGSQDAIPEPGTLALVGIGVTALLRRRRLR